MYHQNGAKLNQADQNIEFIFGENKDYHQIGNAYLEFDITVRKSDSTIFHHDDPIRLVNNAFAFCFKETRLSYTLGSDLEANKFVVTYLLLWEWYQIKMVIYYLDLIIKMRIVSQFLRDLLTFHLKFNPHHTKNVNKYSLWCEYR